MRGDRFALRVGLGDDAAVLGAGPNREWVLSCDASVEGAHFLEGIHPPQSIGYKALARATSDLAAMGAEPRYFLLTLAVPGQKTGLWLDHFGSGMAQAAREWKMRLIGGDLSAAPRVMISITVLGSLTPGEAALRSGARPGDLLYVSGRLGAAQLGLEMIRRGCDRRPSLRKYLRPHFYPRIRVALGRWLAQHGIPSAMMDLSDGLSMDLARLCAASGVGARLWAETIPRTQVPVALEKRSIHRLHLALHGGDDYELLFTVPRRSAKLLRPSVAGVPLTCIGEITRGKKILLVRGDGTSRPLPAKGWSHFRGT